jgi:cell division GTPase FtsZ
MENTKNENLVNEKKLKDVVARVLNEQSFDAIDDETLKVVANDLFTHCTTAAFVQLDSDDLETFATAPKPFLIKIFKGKLPTLKKELAAQIPSYSNGKKHQALVAINYHEELTADELEQLLTIVRNGNEDIDIWWCYAYDKRLPKKEFRVDLLVKKE